MLYRTNTWLLLGTLAMSGLSEANLMKRGGNAAGNPTASMYPLSNITALHFEISGALSLAPYEGSDIGEVLVTIPYITKEDADVWASAWQNIAERTRNKSQSIDAKRYSVSARQAFFRESTYWRKAETYLRTDWNDPRINEYWDNQRKAFDKAISLLQVPGKRFRIPVKAGPDNPAFTVETIWYGNGKPGRSPTIIIGSGYDGSQEDMYHQTCMAALQRGYNCITFEGPGQPTVRREQNVGFIYNWEKVVTPVVDFLLQNPAVKRQVDKNAIGLWGSSFGGYLAPRAAAFEHRLAAVFAVDGVYDFGEALIQSFPPEKLALWKAGNKTAYDEASEKTMNDPNVPMTVKWGVLQGRWAFNKVSGFEFMQEAVKCHLRDVVSQIKTPIFVAEAENEGFFPDQAKNLAKALGDWGTYHLFLNADGAGSHVQACALQHLNDVAYSWFDKIISKRGKKSGE